MLTVKEVATHCSVKPDTVRRWIRAGALQAVRLNRDYRVDWADVWACEHGPMPRRESQERYKAPLLRKSDLARALRVSARTVERWIAEGLPTRDVFGGVRINPHDAADWLTARFDLALDAGDLAAGDPCRTDPTSAPATRAGKPRPSHDGTRT